MVDLTQLEIYINALAEVRYLQTLAPAEGGIAAGDEMYFAYDLRPSSTAFAAEAQGRGEIAQAIDQAMRDAGMRPVNMGCIPTPALTYFALLRGRASIMVTGSHIPFDRNGYKLNTARGELLKRHEQPISAAVAHLRERIYAQPLADSLFNQSGMFKSGPRHLPPASEAAQAAYRQRYASFFQGASLAGKRLLVYQHSAVGRDLLVELLRQFGAEAIPSGRSETFVPIDTENIDAALLATIQSLAAEATRQYGPLDAVVSLDGDSDRPLVLGVDKATGNVRFFGGDLLGMVVAEYLGADAVVVPISCNDAIDRGSLAGVLQPKTRIGSPYVIAGMEQALAQGRQAVCGWEANGGFLTGSDIARNGATLTALPTRDAMLPILGVLFAAAEKGQSLVELFARLPQRFSRAALLKNYPRQTSRKVVEHFSLPGAAAELEGILNPARGFSRIARLDYTDGVRVSFDNGDVVHFRPSGNADEFRIYAVADTQARADALAAQGTAEPDGLLRLLERAVS